MRQVGSLVSVRERLLLASALVGLVVGGGHGARAAGADTQDMTKPKPAKPVVEHVEVVGRTHAVATRASAGTKTDTPLLETTQSVSVVTRSLMDERLVQTLGEALRYVPGVNPETYGADNRFDWFRIRGFDATTYGLYLDGMRFVAGSTGPVQEQYGLENIQILNGPASMLYGQTAPGGLVNMTSKMPTDTAHRELQFVAGSYSRLQGQGDLSGRIPGTNGQLAGRVVFLVRDSDTQVDRVKDNRIYVAPSLTWHVTPDTDVTLLSSYEHDHTSGIQFLPAAGTVLYNPNGRLPTNLFTGSSDQDKWDRNQYSVGMLLAHNFNTRWQFQQSFRYLHLDLNWAQDYGLGVQANDRYLNRLDWHEVTSGNLYTSDSRLMGHVHTGPVEHTLLAGVDYSRYTTSVAEGYATGTAVDLYNPVYITQPTVPMSTHAQQTTTQTGLYLQEQAKLYKRVIVTLSGRYDWATNDTLTRTAAGATAASQNNHAFTYRAGAGYLFPFGLMPYVSYSRSFLPTSGVNYYGQPFKPTYGKQMEVGAKYKPTHMESFLTASLFDLRETNVSQTDPANALNTIQTGEIRVRGFETSATISLMDGLNVVASYTYLDPVIRASTIGQENNTPTLIPHNTLSVWGDYQFQNRGLAAVLSGLDVGMGLRYLGSTEASNDDTFKVPAATVFDGAIHYDFGSTMRWRVGLNINNMFDKIYVASCTGTTSCYYAQRRQFLGSIRIRW